MQKSKVKKAKMQHFSSDESSDDEMIVKPTVQSDSDSVSSEEVEKKPKKKTVKKVVKPKVESDNESVSSKEVETKKKPAKKVAETNKKVAEKSKKVVEKSNKVVEKSTDTEDKKVKKVKDPNAPKKPSTAYILYCKDELPRLKQEQPNVNQKDRLSLAGQNWKTLSDKEKEPYYQLEAKDKKRYQKEMEEYVPTTEVTKQKKPPTGYNEYCRQRIPQLKEEYPDVLPKDRMGIAGAEWKALPDSEKEKYVKMSKES